MKEGDSSKDKSHSLSIHLTTLWPGMPFLGLGVWLAWQLLLFSGGSWISNESESFYIALTDMLICLITGFVLLIAPLFKPFVRIILQSKPWMFTVSLLGALGGLVYLISGPLFLDLQWAAIASLVPISIATALLVLKCGQIYSGLPSHRILVYSLLSLLAAAAIYFFALGSSNFALIDGGPPLIASMVLIILPFAAVWLLLLGAGKPTAEPAAQAEKALATGKAVQTGKAKQSGKAQRSGKATEAQVTNGTVPLPVAFWKLAIAVLIFSLAITTIRSLYLIPQAPSVTQSDYNIVVFLLTIFALTMLLLIIRYLRNISFAKIYLITAILIAVVLVSTPLLPAPGGILSSIACFTGSILEFTIWCLLAFIASEKRYSSITVFGLGRGIVFLGMGIGWALGMFLLPGWQGTIFEISFDIFLALLVILSAVFLFTEKDFDKLFASATTKKLQLDEYTASTNGDTAKKSDQARPWMEACLRVGTKAKLTEREQQIMEHISLGRSQKFIARRLTISLNTVRTHTGNLYAKLNIHSREELVKLIEAENDKQPR